MGAEGFGCSGGGQSAQMETGVRGGDDRGGRGGKGRDGGRAGLLGVDKRSGNAPLLIQQGSRSLRR